MSTDDRADADAPASIVECARRALRSDAPIHWRAALEEIVRRLEGAPAGRAEPTGEAEPAAAAESAVAAAGTDEALDAARAVSVGFDAARLVESVAETVAGRLGERPVELVSLVSEDMPRSVAGSPNVVRRVLVELLDNAVRFTDTGVVLVDCAWADGLRLTVSDTGPGIPPVEQARLFEAPHRPHGGIWRARAGQGMGLASIRTLVERLDGRVEVRSRLGEGTTAQVWLPLAPIDAGETPLPDRIEGRVLLVEDHDRLRAGLARSLEDLGFLVDEASDGRSALRAVRRAMGTYDLALLDAELDDAPGDALADLIGDRPSLRGVPCIAMTHAGDIDGLQVRKPVTRWRLERAVERALGRRLSRRTAADEAPAAAARRRVLVVDDNPDSRRLAARTLEAHAYRVDLARDGIEAVQAAADVTYDLILMDVEMPRLGGLEATRRVRARERAGHRVPIVALTAHDDAEFRERCIEAGMDDHVARPVRSENLLRAVERALGVVADDVAVTPTSRPATADPLGALPSIELDPELLDLLPGFIANRRNDVSALRGWLAGETVDARAVAHGLKGVGGAYGFPAITALGALLGDALRAGDRRRAVRCIDRLDEHIEQIGGALAARGEAS